MNLKFTTSPQSINFRKYTSFSSIDFPQVLHDSSIKFMQEEDRLRKMNYSDWHTSDCNLKSLNLNLPVWKLAEFQLLFSDCMKLITDFKHFSD
jgi:hypothetical protein